MIMFGCATIHIFVVANGTAITMSHTKTKTTTNMASKTEHTIFQCLQSLSPISAIPVFYSEQTFSIFFGWFRFVAKLPIYIDFSQG